MIYLYFSPGNSRCKQAALLLKRNQVEFFSRNLFSNQLQPKEIEHLLVLAKDPEKILQINPALKAQTEYVLQLENREPITELILKNPSLLKRPLLSTDQSLYIQDEIFKIKDLDSIHPHSALH